MAEINTMNDSLVCAQGDKLVIMNPRQRLTREEALRLAAYIVAMTDFDEFRRVYDAVCAV